MARLGAGRRRRCSRDEQKARRRSGVGFGLGGFCGCFFFPFHIFVLDGVEDVAACLALDELGVFCAGDDTNNGVFAGVEHEGVFK